MLARERGGGCEEEQRERGRGARMPVLPIITRSWVTNNRGLRKGKKKAGNQPTTTHRKVEVEGLLGRNRGGRFWDCVFSGITTSKEEGGGGY